MVALLNAVYRVLHNLFVVFDYGLSMILWLGLSQPMTISSRAGLAKRENVQGVKGFLLRELADLLNAMDPGHTDDAIKADIMRANNAIERLTKL